MTRKLIPIVFVVVAAGLIWAAIAGLETAPAARDEAPAIVIQAPAGFVVEELGEAEFESAVSVLVNRTGTKCGVGFTDDGDRVILLVDRNADHVIEMRASRTGTIVERTWPTEVGRRLAWVAEHGNLEHPDLPGASGKNLYH